MNKLIMLSVAFILTSTSLFAQSKKELDLRIDSIQTALGVEKQSVESLTIQLQNTTKEFENTNKNITFLSSLVLKHDSINKLLLSQLNKISISLDSLIQKGTPGYNAVFPNNLFIDVAGQYENCKLFPTPKEELNLENIVYLDIYNEPYTSIEKKNDKNNPTKQWHLIRSNINGEMQQGWTLTSDFSMLVPNNVTSTIEYAGIYELMVPHPAHELIIVEVDRVTQEIKGMSMTGSFENGKVIWCGADDTKINDFSSAIEIKNVKTEGFKITAESSLGWFVKAENKSGKPIIVKGLIWNGFFYRKVR